jgi:hypothetical protein
VGSELFLSDFVSLRWFFARPKNLGLGWLGEAAFRCETVIARFPHPKPAPMWGRGNDA